MNLVYEYLSGCNAWTVIPDKEIICIWNEIFPEYEINDGDPTFKTVDFLVHHDVNNNWIKGFSAAAFKALNDVWKAQKLNTQEEWAEFVSTMLGVAADPLKTCVKALPFIFSSTYEGGWSQVPKEDHVFEGIFLGPLVLRTLANHLDLADNPLSLESSAQYNHKPKGVLVMSIQAVQCILSFSHTGIIELPKGQGKESTEFSSKNFKDFPECKDGKIVMKRHSTLWDARIDIMTDSDWEAIIDGAMEYRKSQHKGKGKNKLNAEVMVEDTIFDSGDDDNGDSTLLYMDVVDPSS
ncbi:hypothetical protein BDQ17DRAFT_1327503 [Cyathus striatus]|nr:hypothetical protein BDQ17DRAFT_1327503 [Cyathus striatus]